MPREYPRVGETRINLKWKKHPEMAPLCAAPGCECRATCKPWVQVDYMRGNDEQGPPVCKEHTEAAPLLLLEWAAARKAENRRKEEQARQRKLAKKE